MTDQVTSDWVVLTRTSTATEAQILKGCLEASGIQASLADQHLVQTNAFLTSAVGGVRLLVAGPDLANAQQVLREFQAGQFKLDDEPDHTPATTPIPGQAAIWNPDVAALWSLPFTPLFGAVIHWFNACTLGDGRLKAYAAFWLLVNALMCTGAVFLIARSVDHAQANAFFRLLLGLYTVVWYLMGARQQSKHVLTRHGTGYARRHWGMPLILATLVSVLVSIALNDA